MAIVAISRIRIVIDLNISRSPDSEWKERK
jgi:hypothetical protein